MQDLHGCTENVYCVAIARLLIQVSQLKRLIDYVSTGKNMHVFIENKENHKGVSYKLQKYIYVNKLLINLLGTY